MGRKNDAKTEERKIHVEQELAALSAIINRGEKEELSELKEAYVREDEIPFDFSRRRPGHTSDQLYRDLYTLRPSGHDSVFRHLADPPDGGIYASGPDPEIRLYPDQ